MLRMRVLFLAQRFPPDVGDVGGELGEDLGHWNVEEGVPHVALRGGWLGRIVRPS